MRANSNHPPLWSSSMTMERGSCHSEEGCPPQIHAEQTGHLAHLLPPSTWELEGSPCGGPGSSLLSGALTAWWTLLFKAQELRAGRAHRVSSPFNTGFAFCHCREIHCYSLSRSQTGGGGEDRLPAGLPSPLHSKYTFSGATGMHTTFSLQLTLWGGTSPQSQPKLLAARGGWLYQEQGKTLLPIPGSLETSTQVCGEKPSLGKVIIGSVPRDSFIFLNLAGNKGKMCCNPIMTDLHLGNFQYFKRNQELQR